MSKDKIWTNVCSPESTINLDINNLCGPSSPQTKSPIDDFITYIKALMPIGTVESLTSHPTLGRLLFLGVISGTELYFRSILSGLVSACPFIRNRVNKLQVSFGAIDYYGSSDLGLGLFENVSFATEGEIKKQTQKITGVDCCKDPSSKNAIEEYEKLCQFRHASVHSRGHLGHLNIHQLGVAATGRRLCLDFDLTTLQKSTALCQNAIRAYNKTMFQQIVQNWLGKKILTGTWKQDQEKYSKLFKLFYSKEDNTKPANAYQSYRGLKPCMAKIIDEEKKRPVVKKTEAG